MTKLKNVVVLDKTALLAIANGEKVFDNRLNNTGRPVNKKSARQIRLNKQRHYDNVNKLFVSGKSFKINNNTYTYSAGDNGDLGCIVDGIGFHQCNVSYIGRTKVKCYSFTLGKKVNVELNLKTLEFVS
jgi:regulator of replication initiation timing